MQVHRDLTNLPSFKNAVITIGTFDGMHSGHQQITRLLKEEAESIKGESIIITFDPHPRMVLANKDPAAKEHKKISLLNTLEEKIALIEKQGVDHLVIVPFTQEFSLLTAEEYIENFLVKQFHPHTIIIGYDHHFGRQRQGNYKLLEARAAKYHYNVKEIPEHIINHLVISSTRVREAIAAGDIDTANEFLGYDYFFEGRVVEGDKIGRTLGYPTANLAPAEPDKLVPCDGIYAVTLLIDPQGNPEERLHSDCLKGMMSIGFRPTVGGTKRVIEVNIFDFNETIYGKRMKVFLKKYLREEVKFDDLEALKTQMAKDKINTLKVLG